MIGDYGQAKVNLEGNTLTEFREDVFKIMLEQMSMQPPGIGSQVLVAGSNYQSIYTNMYYVESPITCLFHWVDPFDCGCGLAWLIRANANLLPLVKNGVCGGFFRFEDLNPDSYENCQTQTTTIRQ